MYISSLVLHGFKSFGKRTALTFGEGITGLVGPNGCGKTNLVDALRWVLGEQRQSVLRSARMEEVIYHGSRSRKPANFSEVTLSIHNNKSTLPLEYTDIDISRRLYRDGESEYLINGNPCRLKDITDLFLDTGMGSDAYSVIELKMIEAILSDVEDDRRRMFEEAAGINKYRQQRSSAQRKLQATNLDLERVSDIIGEVAGQVKVLGLQLKRYERHHKLSIELKSLELELARRQINVLAQKMAPLQKVLASGRDVHQSEATRIAKEEEQLEQLQATLSQRESQQVASRIDLADSIQTLAGAKEQMLVWNEQVRATRQSLTRFESERDTEAQRGRELETDLADLVKQLGGVVPVLESANAAFQAKRGEERAVIESFQQEERRLLSAREAVFDQRHLVQDAEAAGERSQKALIGQPEELARIEQAASDAAENGQSLEKQAVEARKRLIEQQDRLESRGVRKAQVEARGKELDQRLSTLVEERHRHTTQAQVLQSRLDIFSRLVASYDGYPSGTREVLLKKAQFPGLIGTVAGLARVEPMYALAVETALGPFASCAVARTTADARELLAYARGHGLGRLSVIPLDRIGELYPLGPPVPSDEAPPGIPLVSLVTAPEELTSLYALILDGYYWTAEDEFPGSAPPPGTTVITAAGHLLGSVPYLTHPGGVGTENLSPSAAGGSILGRTGEIEMIREALAGEEAQAKQASDEWAEVQAQRESLGQDLLQLSRDLDAARREADSITAELARLEGEQQRAADEFEQTESQLPQLKSSLAGLQESLRTTEVNLSQLADRRNQLDQTVAQALKDYEQVRRHRDAWQSELQEIRLELLTQENRRESLAERRLSLEDTLAASNGRATRLDNDRKAAGATIEKLTAQLASAGEQRTDLERQLASRQAAAEDRDKAVKLVHEEVSRLEEQIRQQQHGQTQVLSEHRDLENQLAGLQKEEALIRSRIRDVYAADIPTSANGAGETDEGVLRDQIEKMSGSLERIGPINMAVAEEYAEESQRNDFLTAQRDDLLQAEQSLGETLRKIDQQARDQFRDTFDKIRHHFKHTFTLFFEGGEGDLKLIGDPDPLLSGIEIIAQPPGKKTRSLRALSGGEKALTAISLLFATYLVKPSPFCILDEVDAPLDDANIRKFTRVIGQFAKDTQFIIVTHNKLTMQSVDYLYGVTMAEEGLSSLVSVNLREYAN